MQINDSFPKLFILMNLKKLLFSAVTAIVSSVAMAQNPLVLSLYGNSKPPYDNGDKATVTVYPAPESKATGRAILILPGGAYEVLASGHEGKEWAPFFNKLGITVAVLEYRMPKGDCRVPIADAEHAMKLLRGNAKKWHINRNDVGIMGSSAGGHLASTVATKSKGDAAPNFQILFYPVITMDPAFTHIQSHDNFLGKKASRKKEAEYSSDLQVNRTTPRAWIALSDNDDLVLPANGVNYYIELYRHDVPAALHVYPTGGHGWGCTQGFDFHNEMQMELRGWLESF